MRLSFVIPTRNQGRFIKACIDSCLAQGIADSEIVVVDGASTDDTLAILAAYGDRISFVSEPDRGQSDAINKGVRRAAGEIVAWINSDDYYADSGAVRRLLEAFDEDAAVDVVYGDGVQVDRDGHEIRRFPSRPIERLAQILIQPASFVMQPALLFRRRLFREVGGLDESLHYTMDYDLWIRMFERARATRYVRTTVVCARYHEDAKSIAGMGRQVRELCLVKLRNVRRARMAPIDLLRMQVGIASLFAYWLAVRTGLRRAA